MAFNLSLTIGITLALFMVPGLSVQQCYHCNFTEKINCAGLLMTGGEDGCYIGMEKANSISIVNKSCQWQNCSGYDPFLSQTFNNFSNNYWFLEEDDEEEDLESNSLNKKSHGNAMVTLSKVQILIGLLWLLL